MLILAACGQGAPAMLSCSGSFELTRLVQNAQDPAAGKLLEGTLSIDVDATGGFTGTFTDNNGQSVNVTGQALGRTISLAFESARIPTSLAAAR